MSGRLALGVDVGSTSTKVALVEVTGGHVHERGASVAATPARADDLVALVLRLVVDRLSDEGSRVEAIGVASMAETGVPVDADGRPLTELLRWDAGHGREEAVRLAEHAAEVFARTGVRLSAKTPLSTWAWLGREHPAVVRDWSSWLGAADVVVHGLTGTPVTDHTLAGRTGAYLLGESGGRPPETFDPGLAALAGLRSDQLPQIAPLHGPAGQVTPAAAAVLGVRAGVPVVVAGHDHQVAAWAAGVRAPGDYADSLGTAEAILGVISARPPLPAISAQGMSLVRTIAGTHEALVAGSGSAGAALSAWLERFPTAERAEVLERAAGDRLARPAPTGAPVGPYLAGRQSPLPDPTARAGTPPSGWDAARQARAVVEGICYQARWMATEQTVLGDAVETLVIVGGDRLPRLWLETKHAASPWPTARVEAAEPVAAGAAVLALARTGGPHDVSRAPTLRRTERSAGTDRHDAAYARFVAAARGATG